MSMVQNHYIINVSVRDIKPNWKGEDRYVHLFATTEHSATTFDQMRNVLTHIEQRFPFPQYAIDVTEVNCSGTSMDVNQILRARGS